jgi:mono/diheme cytochrome c family protein
MGEMTYWPLERGAIRQNLQSRRGSAMGLSSFMPAWKGILKNDEIQDLVRYIRTLAQPSK